MGIRMGLVVVVEQACRGKESVRGGRVVLKAAQTAMKSLAGPIGIKNVVRTSGQDSFGGYLLFRGRIQINGNGAFILEVEHCKISHSSPRIFLFLCGAERKGGTSSAAIREVCAISMS
jgi:hypothetical protein